MSFLLFILYPLAIQFERGGWWLLVTPITLVSLVIDILANYTELALLTLDWPRSGEWTFSQRLVRLKKDTGWRGALVVPIVKYVNYFDPDGVHV